MFGYVKPHQPDLRVRDYECYRAYYCGLCRAMGKCTGQCSRMTLSYDFVFLATVRCYLTGEAPQFEKKRCLVHPLRRRLSVVNSKQLNYCADASALLSYHKCRDDWQDERGLKRLRGGLLQLLLSTAYRRAKKRHPELDQRLQAHLEQLNQHEQSNGQASADVPAEIFGNLMRDVCREGLEGIPARLAAEIGQTVGRWIYLTDAADDLSEDRRRHRFNPYNKLFPNPPTEQDAETLRIALKSILCETERAYRLMGDPPCSEIGEILANILYLGMPMAADRVLNGSFLGKKDSCAKSNKQTKTTKKETDHE